MPKSETMRHLGAALNSPILAFALASRRRSSVAHSSSQKRRLMSRFRMLNDKAGERRKQQETKDNDEHTPAIKSSHPSPQAPAQRAQVARSRPPASALAHPCHTACTALWTTAVNLTDTPVDGQIAQRTHPRTVPRPTVRAGRSQPHPSRHPQPEHSEPQQA